MTTAHVGTSSLTIHFLKQKPLPLDGRMSLFFWNTSLLHGLWLLYLRKSLCQRKIQLTCPSIHFSHSVVSDCDPIDCSKPGFLVHHQLPEFTQTHVHWVSDASNHLILCCNLLLPPSILTSTRIFSNESVLCIRWPKYWSFIFSMKSFSPSNEYSGLISFRMD